MKTKFLKNILFVPIIAILLYFTHSFVFKNFNINENQFTYSLLWLYLFFGATSTLIFGLMLIIKQKNLDQVGMSFMAVTVAKMLVCVALIKPILTTNNENSNLEKFNFFVIETVLTIRILNNKQ
jgi:hypothetical protein